MGEARSEPPVGRPTLERLATGIPGLDEVLDGGLVRGGVHLVGGRTGTGKTTLGNHLAYNQAGTGEVAIVATVLAETHARMLAHLAGFRFFDPSVVAQRVHYVSLFDELAATGLGGVLDLLRRLVREHRARLLVIDGAGIFEEYAPSSVAFRRFTAELVTQLSALDCTTVLLVDRAADDLQAIGVHVDGILVLEDVGIGLRDVRLLHVVKVRGVPHLRGRHHIAITAAGVEVYPRLESITAAVAPVVGERRERQGFGVPGLDDMLRGGVLAASTTLIEGAPGTGKTLAGLHFVADGAHRGEPGLIAGFHEPPARLIAKAEAVGLELGSDVAAGRIRLLWHPPLEQPLDAWAGEVLGAIAELQPRRFFVDGLADVQRLAVFPERFPAFVAALANMLRAHGVTTLFATETASVVGALPDVSMPAISATVENVILLRYVELRSHLRRLVSIIKVRDGDFDTALREFVITGRGLEVAATFESAEAVLTGVARLLPPRSGGAPDAPAVGTDPPEEAAP